MLINQQSLDHWMDHFYGYGSWDAAIWFIAYEEAGGDLPEEVAERLDFFNNAHPDSTQPTLCDIRALYRHVRFRAEGPRSAKFDTLHDYRFGENAILHGIWKNLIAFGHGFRNEDLPDLLTYQKSTFASGSAKREALIRLYPLPSPHAHAWYYSWLDLPRSPFLKSRTAYEEHAYARRVGSILSQIAAHRPRLVLMYGMSDINQLKASVQSQFPGTRFQTVKSIKHRIPQHHRATLGTTTVLITTQTPALRHNRIETGFDWQELGKTVIPG